MNIVKHGGKKIFEYVCANEVKNTIKRIKYLVEHKKEIVDSLMKMEAE